MPPEKVFTNYDKFRCLTSEVSNNFHYARNLSDFDDKSAIFKSPNFQSYNYCKGYDRKSLTPKIPSQ